MISRGESIWFVHTQYEPPLPLCLRRVNEFGACVDGGKTGHHSTGHGETYWDKFVEIVKFGYVPVSVAKELGMLSQTWEAPEIDSLNAMVADGAFCLRR